MKYYIYPTCNSSVLKEKLIKADNTSKCVHHLFNICRNFIPLCNPISSLLPYLLDSPRLILVLEVEFFGT